MIITVIIFLIFMSKGTNFDRIIIAPIYTPIPENTAVQGFSGGGGPIFDSLCGILGSGAL